MASIGVRLPLTLDTTDGFGAIKTIRQMINQNLKMLDFGVGINQFLFSSFSSDVYSQIDLKIREQISIYMPTVTVKEVNFYSVEPDSNKVSFRLVYSIPSIGVNDLLEITI